MSPKKMPSIYLNLNHINGWCDRSLVITRAGKGLLVVAWDRFQTTY